MRWKRKYLRNRNLHCRLRCSSHDHNRNNCGEGHYKLLSSSLASWALIGTWHYQDSKSHSISRVWFSLEQFFFRYIHVNVYILVVIRMSNFVKGGMGGFRKRTKKEKKKKTTKEKGNKNGREGGTVQPNGAEKKEEDFIDAFWNYRV